MIVVRLSISDVVMVTPRVVRDSRGYFFESFRQQAFENAIERRVTFVQENQSHSKKGVLRGLHYQLRHPQGKLVRVLQGAIWDVAVDIRRTSPTFGQWVAEVLSAENARQLWIPDGFAHGFMVLGESADVLYKTTTCYAPADEHVIVWNDPDLRIDWPSTDAPVISAKDAAAFRLSDADVFD